MIVEPSEKLIQIRAESAEGLKTAGSNSQTNLDINQNIREIIAILQTNAEIFHRVSPDIAKQCTGQDGSFTKFVRHAFDVVKTIGGDSTAEFTTSLRRSEKNIDTKSLKQLPSDLDGIVSLKFKSEPFVQLIDYESFFENSLNLHEDVLGPFLARLKDHIMNVQVCLGKIDEWLLVEPTYFKAFLESTFGAEIPDLSVIGLGDFVLKEFNVSGEFMISFDIVHESEQRKLIKFLEFTTIESPEFGRQLKVGDFVDARDNTGRWYEAVVRGFEHNLVKVHFFGWGSKWDMHLPTEKGPKGKKLPPQPLWSKTQRWREEIQVGDHVEVRESSSTALRPKWLWAKIIEVGCEFEPQRTLLEGAELEKIGENEYGEETPLLLLGRKRQVKVEVFSTDISTRWVNLYGEEICQENTHKSKRTYPAGSSVANATA